MDTISTKPELKKHNYTTKILDKEFITDNIIVLTLENPGFEFTSGQHVIISFEDDLYDREYSIYSSEDETNIKLLIKIVEDGYFTKKLLQTSIGTKLNLRGPHGIFCPDFLSNENKTHYLICTGTGLAPFNSFINSYPELEFIVIHGIRHTIESKLGDGISNYFPCVSRDTPKDEFSFKGRVTEYLKTISLIPNSVFYLCGNFDMIYDVETYLVENGINPNDIHKEVYF